MELYCPRCYRREVRELPLHCDHHHRDRDIPDYRAILPAPEYRVQLHAEIFRGLSIPSDVGTVIRRHSLYHHSAGI